MDDPYEPGTEEDDELEADDEYFDWTRDSPAYWRY